MGHAPRSVQRFQLSSQDTLQVRVEVKDSRVLGAAQDPYAMVGVYKIPEVLGDVAKDTQLDLGASMGVLDDGN